MFDEKMLKSIEQSIEKTVNAECHNYIEQHSEYNPTIHIERNLEEINQDFEKYRADQAAYHAAQEHSHKLAEKRQFWLGVFAGAIGSTIAGLIVLAVQSWPAIVSFFVELFQ